MSWFDFVDSKLPSYRLFLLQNMLLDLEVSDRIIELLRISSLAIFSEINMQHFTGFLKNPFCTMISLHSLLKGEEMLSDSSL